MTRFRLQAAIRLPQIAGSPSITGDTASTTGGGGTGLVPDAPVFLRTTGSLVGQATIAFLKPDYRGDGSAISGDPVTATRLYAFTTQDAADAGSLGSYAATTNCGTASSGTLTLSAGTYWICAECENSGGASYPSQPIQVTVT